MEAVELEDPSAHIKALWESHLELKTQLVTRDDFAWALPSPSLPSSAPPPGDDAARGGTHEEKEELCFIGGVDISFVKGDPVNACASLVVLSYPQLQALHHFLQHPSPRPMGRSYFYMGVVLSRVVVWEAERMVKLELPYIPGFLAFREVPHLVPLFEQLRADQPSIWPQARCSLPLPHTELWQNEQVVFVDGNGVLHPRGFGLASHLGVLTGIPTIGVGKTFFHVDGLDMREVKAQAAAACHKGGDWIPLVGQSGVEWGAAFRSTDGSSNPIYVSVGHRISLASAVRLTQASCLHRVPEPIRQADLRSREFLRKQGH